MFEVLIRWAVPSVITSTYPAHPDAVTARFQPPTLVRMDSAASAYPPGSHMVAIAEQRSPAFGQQMIQHAAILRPRTAYKEHADWTEAIHNIALLHSVSSTKFAAIAEQRSSALGQQLIQHAELLRPPTTATPKEHADWIGAMRNIALLHGASSIDCQDKSNESVSIYGDRYRYTNTTVIAPLDSDHDLKQAKMNEISSSALRDDWGDGLGEMQSQSMPTQQQLNSQHMGADYVPCTSEPYIPYSEVAMPAEAVTATANDDTRLHATSRSSAMAQNMHARQPLDNTGPPYVPFVTEPAAAILMTVEAAMPEPEPMTTDAPQLAVRLTKAAK